MIVILAIAKHTLKLLFYNILEFKNMFHESQIGPVKGDSIFHVIYIILVSSLAFFYKSLRETIGVHFTKKWKNTEKEDIVSIDEAMLPEVLKIQAEAFDGKNPENIIKYSTKFREMFYVIKSQDKIAGYCAYYLKPEFSFNGLRKKSVIYSIAIDNEFRGKGYGRKLLEESIKEMKLNGIYSTILYVNVKNTPAIKLYEKMGFQKIRETEGICGENEKCYIMELKLA